MASENEKKYGVIAGTAKDEVEKGVKDTLNSIGAMAGLVKNAAGFLKDDIKSGWDWLNKSPEEKAEAKAKEDAERKQKDDEAKAAKAAEDARMATLQKSYIAHSAAIKCTHAVRVSFVVVPTGHGEFIHGIPQLNVGDSKPGTNIVSFGVCKSPENPSVKEAAKKILKEINDKPKSFTEKVMSFFCKDPAPEVGKDLLAKCAGVCDAQITMDWDDGKKDVLIDGKPALLGRCKLQCGYNGVITLFTSGQMEE